MTLDSCLNIRDIILEPLQTVFLKTLMLLKRMPIFSKFTPFKSKIRNFFEDEQSNESLSLLLSQELDFEFSKSILTFALAFLGGIFTLKTALQWDKPIENGFIMAIIASTVSAVLAFSAQYGIIEDLRQKRIPSSFRRQLRILPPSVLLGIALSGALQYFELMPVFF